MARPTDPSRALCLIGLRCSGKTQVGRELARRRGWEFGDLDDELLALARESDTFDSVGDVLARLGQPAFRALESDVLARALARPGPRVLATGGGVVEREANRELLAGVTCVWLRAEPEVLRARMRADPSPRPPLIGTGTDADSLDEIEALLQRREPWYRAVATLEIDANAGSPSALCTRLEAALVSG